MSAGYAVAICASFLALLVLIMVSRLQDERAARETFAKFAGRYDLKFRGATWPKTRFQAYGLFRGKHVLVQRIVEGSGDTRVEYMCCDVRLDDAWKSSATIRGREFSDKLKSFVGKESAIKTPNQTFNETIFVSDDIGSKRCAALGSPDVQRTLCQLSSLYTRLSIENGKLVVQERGATRKVLPIKMALDRLCDAADVLNESLREPARLEADEEELFADIQQSQTVGSGKAW